MTSFIDPQYLRGEQYKTPENLNARVSLHQQFRTNPYPWHRWVFDQLRVTDHSKIFEIGCGPGFLWAENSERIPASWSIQLADLSLGMLKAAKASMKKGDFSYLVADAQHIPVASNRFDVVIANHMLYHVPEVDLAFSEIHRVLRRGGTLYATANGSRNLIEIWEWVTEALPSRTDILSSREAVLRFSLDNGKKLLSQYFPSVTLTRYPDSLEITEAQPVVDFVASSSMQVALSQHELNVYGDFLVSKLKAEKVLKVTKDMGIFKAER